MVIESFRRYVFVCLLNTVTAISVYTMQTVAMVA